MFKPDRKKKPIQDSWATSDPEMCSHTLRTNWISLFLYFRFLLAVSRLSWASQLNLKMFVLVHICMEWDNYPAVTTNKIWVNDRMKMAKSYHTENSLHHDTISREVMSMIGIVYYFHIASSPLGCAWAIAYLTFRKTLRKSSHNKKMGMTLAEVK